MKQTTLKLLSLLVLSCFIVPPAYATSLPSFPSCVNPQGTVKVQYDNGVHGIAGRSAEYRGKDTVYSLSANDQLMQCFCPEDGNGVQTNWLKVSTYSEEEIKRLTYDGWIYIADGSVWGLDEAPYIAKNSDYSCKSTSISHPSSPSTSSNPSSGSSSSPIQSVLSLASTGNIAFLYALITLGFLSLISGLVLKLKRK